ncbi:MAG: hypothetical protein L0154_29005, partial [Chloroflexi bacterium]|nr:hypothetical protein [Chloroflexota bacterium]
NDWYTPDDGRFVLLPDWEKMHALAQDFVTPPTGNRLDFESSTIEIYDGTLWGAGWGQVAADRLAWEGFSPVVIESRNIATHEISLLYDYTGAGKGSEIKHIMEILRIGESQVQDTPDANAEYDYRVVVGRSYNACIHTSSADDVELPELPPEVAEQQEQ